MSISPSRLTDFFSCAEAFKDKTCPRTMPLDKINLKKELDSADSNDDDDDDDHDDIAGPFLCEVCDSSAKVLAVFKERHHLETHTLRRHPTTCVRCYETLDTVKELEQHMDAFGHRPPKCLDEQDKSEVRMNDIKVEDDAMGNSELGEISNDSDNSEEEEEEEGEGDDIDDDTTLSCMHCDADGLRTLSELRHHTGIEHKTVCCICFEGFDLEEALHRHQNAMKHSVWRCDVCHMTFVQKRRFSIHMTTQHPEVCAYQCPQCDNKYFSKIGLDDHIRYSHTRSKPPKAGSDLKGKWRISMTMCSLCDFPCVTRYSLVLHMFEHHNEPGETHVFKCELCNVGFCHGREFEWHLKDCHLDDDEYLLEARAVLEDKVRFPACDKCSKTYSCKKGVLRHLRSSHPSDLPEKCHMCGLRFTNDDYLRKHLKYDHELLLPMVCPVCNKKYDKSPKLLQHLKMIHNYRGMNEFYCFIHNKGFMIRELFHSHFRSLHIQAPKICPPPKSPCNICGKKIPPNRKKIHHKTVHEEHEKVKCKVCGVVINPHSLDLHMAKHTDAYKCETCGKTFEAKALLNRHLVVHSGEKPFECDLCGLRVTQKSSLQRHQKVVHPNGEVKEKDRRPFLRRTRGPLVPKEKASPAAVADGDVMEKSAVVDDGTAETKENSTGDGGSAKGRRGRPRKRKVELEAAAEAGSVIKKARVVALTKRCGRPRKRKDLQSEEETTESEVDDDVLLQFFEDSEEVKRKRGRPAKKKQSVSLIT